MPSPLRNRALRHFLLAEESIVADRGEEKNDSTRAFEIIFLSPPPRPFLLSAARLHYHSARNLKKRRKSASKAQCIVSFREKTNRSRRRSICRTFFARSFDSRPAITSIVILETNKILSSTQLQSTLNVGQQTRVYPTRVYQRDSYFYRIDSRSNSQFLESRVVAAATVSSFTRKRRRQASRERGSGRKSRAKSRRLEFLRYRPEFMVAPALAQVQARARGKGASLSSYLAAPVDRAAT